jgi:hypothetical protein
MRDWRELIAVVATARWWLDVNESIWCSQGRDRRLR